MKSVVQPKRCCTPGGYCEVAAACDVPVGTIRSRLARGRKTLRELTGVAPPLGRNSLRRKAPVVRQLQQ